MIEIKTKVHDNFSIEFKQSFVVNDKVKKNNFAVNTWIFVPNSLDINPFTYGKDQFYRDVKSNVRLITPVFLLRDIALNQHTPLTNLRKAMSELASAPDKGKTIEYEYQIKMYCAISKSAMRDEVFHIYKTKEKSDCLYLTQEYLNNVKSILSAYRSLKQIINVPTVSDGVRDFFSFGDEYLGHIASIYTIRILQKIESVERHGDIRDHIADFLKENENYKIECGYPIVSKEDDTLNRNLVYRHGMLKKFIESVLFIKLDKKKDGVAVEQMLYAIAAGIAMIFATVISFFAQKTFGSLSIPLFIILIISYMLKDRIKDLTRYYFAHKLGDNFFDNKAVIKIKDADVGWIKEGVDFINDSKTPKEVLNIRNRTTLLRAENTIFDEKIILYRKMVYINSQKLAANYDYPISGINDIFRIHVTRFTQKMDNPDQSLSIINDNGGIDVVVSQNIYYLNIIMQVRYEEHIEYKRFRLVMTRDGIQSVEEIN